MAYLATDLEGIENHEGTNVFTNGFDFIIDTITFSDEASTKMERFAGSVMISLLAMFGAWKYLEYANGTSLALLK